MTEEEIINRVTNVLTPPFKVGDLVKLRDTQLFTKARVEKIERGWVHFRSLTHQHICGALGANDVDHYVDS